MNEYLLHVASNITKVAIVIDVVAGIALLLMINSYVASWVLNEENLEEELVRKKTLKIIKCLLTITSTLTLMIILLP